MKSGCQHFCDKEATSGSLFVFVDIRKYRTIECTRRYCHGFIVSAFHYALISRVSGELKLKIAQLHAFGLSPTQIIQEHTKEA